MSENLTFHELRAKQVHQVLKTFWLSKCIWKNTFGIESFSFMPLTTEPFWKFARQFSASSAGAWKQSGESKDIFRNERANIVKGMASPLRHGFHEQKSWKEELKYLLKCSENYACMHGGFACASRLGSSHEVLFTWTPACCLEALDAVQPRVYDFYIL